MLSSLALGFVSAIGAAVIMSIPNFVNRTHFSFYRVIPIVVSMVFILLLVLCRKKILGEKEGQVTERRKKVYENLFTAAVFVYVVSSHFYYLPNFFLQTNAFVYYGESAISTIVLYRVIGYLLAVLSMIVSAVMVYHVGMKLKVKAVGIVGSIALMIMGITEINVIVQRLYSLRIIPKNKAVFSMIAFVSNNVNYFYFGMMVFLAIIPVLLILKNLKIVETFSNSAQLRKIKYLMRRKRRLSAFLIFMLVLNISSLTFVKSYANREVPLSPPEDYTIVDGVVELPLEDFEDDKLHRYEYKSQNGINVRFIVIKKSGASYGVCLDACEICGPSGYFMRGEDVVCKLCDVVMNKGTIGFKGGCNPIPIKYMIHDKKIKIYVEELENLDYIFK